MRLWRAGHTGERPQKHGGNNGSYLPDPDVCCKRNGRDGNYWRRDGRQLGRHIRRRHPKYLIQRKDADDTIRQLQHGERLGRRLGLVWRIGILRNIRLFGSFGLFRNQRNIGLFWYFWLLWNIWLLWLLGDQRNIWNKRLFWRFWNFGV